MKKILITRPIKQAKKFQMLLKGIETVLIPTIKILPLVPSEEDTTDIIEHIVGGSWSVFTSANAVAPVSNLFITRSPIAAVGEETASELREHNVHVSFVPQNKTGIGLAEELYDAYADTLLKNPVLIFQGSSASDDVSNYLKSKDVKVKKYLVYDVQDVLYPELGLLDVLKLIDLIHEKELVLTFFSGKTAKNFINLLPELFCLAKNADKLASLLKESPVVVIGHKTREVVEGLGFKNILEPESKQSESMVKMLKAMILPN